VFPARHRAAHQVGEAALALGEHRVELLAGPEHLLAGREREDGERVHRDDEADAQAEHPEPAAGAEAEHAEAQDGAERRTDVGERLSEGTVAFVVEQTAPLKLRFRAPERYLAALRQGLPVEALAEAYPGQPFAGTVSLVGGSVDPQTRTFLVEAEFPNRDRRLRPGLFARVEVDLGARQ